MACVFLRLSGVGAILVFVARAVLDKFDLPPPGAQSFASMRTCLGEAGAARR